MYADGDPIGELPLRVRAIGGAVRVLVPTGGAGADAFLATGAAAARRTMSAILEPKLALARAVGAVSRLRGGGGTSLPGKLLMRMDSSAIAELAARLPRGSVVVSATNGKTTTAAMAASIFAEPASRSCTTRPAPTWPAGSPRRCSMPRGAAARSPASWGCSRWTSCGWIGSRRQLQPARGRARQPVSRPA